MDSRKLIAALPAFALFSTLLAGCESMSMPSLFGGGAVERSRVPPNSTAYQCTGGKRLYIRYIDNGAAAWVILPEREFRLDKVAGEGGARYSSGNAVLTVNGDEVNLSDGPAVSYAACKVPAPAAAAEPAKK
jgi:membrane-bound inhibitor of C-type lysozyme